MTDDLRMRWFGISLLAVLLVAACSGSKSDDADGPLSGGFGPGLSISEAMKTDAKGPLLINGWLLATSANDVRLCESLTTPEPPRCGQPSVAVRGLDLARTDTLKQAQGTTWSLQPLRLLGTLKNGVLTVSDTTRG
jgi:hypothetical protein